MLAIIQFTSVAQSCLTLYNPMNCSSPSLPVHHQLLEFTQTHVHRVGDAIQQSHPLSSPSSPAPNPSQHQSLFQCKSESEVAQSCPTLCGLWTVAHQAPLSMGFSRQEYWTGLPFPSPGDLPDPGIKPRSFKLQANALTSAPPGKPRYGES